MKDFHVPEEAPALPQEGELEEVTPADYPILLTYEGSKKWITLYEKRLQEVTFYPITEQRLSYRQICEQQVRLLVRHLKGEGSYQHYQLRMWPGRGKAGVASHGRLNAIGGTMFVVVSYDVVDDRKRAKIAKAMKSYGERVQKSVFECRIDDQQFLRMKKALENIMDMNEDSIRYYFLCKGCVERIEISGWGTVTEDESLIIVWIPMVEWKTGGPEGERAVGRNKLNLLSIEKVIHQERKMRKNKGLTNGLRRVYEAEKGLPPGAPECSAKFLKLKKEKGGELEELTWLKRDCD
jgi:CRISPR-associated protein Cas2